MELGLKGKVAIVTGASRGIGRAIALELANEGCTVALAARDAAAMEGLAGEICTRYGLTSLVHAADLRDPAVPARLAAAAVEAFGRIDLVVNNAGATKRGSFFELTDADFEDGFALKFYGTVRLTRAAWPHLKKSRGAVVNIIGVGGHQGHAQFAIGGAVNAALQNFTKAMADLGIDDGVRVNAINPGWIETDRLKTRLAARARADGIDEAEVRRRSLAELGVKRFGRPEEIAQLACFLASEPAAYLHGALIDMDGGETRDL
jgi:NAD(P)-dependent dehydrogenase (short-subunit alcohol dehydrogenase family)